MFLVNPFEACEPVSTQSAKECNWKPHPAGTCCSPTSNVRQQPYDVIIVGPIATEPARQVAAAIRDGKRIPSAELHFLKKLFDNVCLLLVL
jgi:hypothetical protein